MKTNIKIIGIALGALLAGLAIGYFLFRSDAQTPSSETHQHADMMSEAANETWTCSMHPQIRQEEPGDCPICGMDLIPLEESSGNDPLVLEMTREAVKLADIQTTVVRSGSRPANQLLRMSGKIQADERQVASLVAHVPGRIEKLFITFTGEEVQKGQKLATIYSPELISAQQELLEALRLRELNPDLLEAARKKLRYWKIAEADIRAIESSGEIRELFTVVADKAGVVTRRRVAVGDYVPQGAVLFDVVDLSTLWVLFDAYEEDLPLITVGDRVEFRTPALPGRTFSTRITFVDPVIDPETRVAKVRAEVKNTRGALKPEMLVYGTLQKRSGGDEAVRVPKSAVMWTGPRSVVYVKLPGRDIPSFAFREVELGESFGDAYEVLAGLEAGEEVVTYGSFVIDAAAQLNNQASMMNKDVLLDGQDPGAQVPDYRAQRPSGFQDRLSGVLQAYLSLKDALVAADSTVAREKAEEILTLLDKWPDPDFEELAAQRYWEEKAQALRTQAENISNGEVLSSQRAAFDPLSQALIHAVKAFGVREDTVYVQHCPMAFNDEGADWISTEEEIRNPYFGDLMLTCGLIEETLTP